MTILPLPKIFRRYSFGERFRSRVKPITLVFLFALFASTNVLAQVDVGGSPGSTTANINDIFTIDIVITAGTTDLNAAEVHLDFDPAVLEIQSFTAGTTLPSRVISSPTLPAGVFDNVNGTIDYSAGINNATVNGTFTLLSLEVKALAGASSSLLNFRTAQAEFPRLTEIANSGNSVLGTATDIDITVNAPNSTPIINSIGNASVDETGSIQIPLVITDADGDNLTVSITTASNEPQELQSNNNAPQTDPYPFDASAFFSENNVVSSAGSYSSSLDFSPTFGDGGSNGDGNGVYTVTIQVDDEDGNTVTETFDLTVNDFVQGLSASGVIRIEAESYDNQGNSSTALGIGVEDQSGTGGVINIGFTTNNDFAEYLIDVPVAGTYQFDFAVAKASGAVGTMTINGGPSISVNATGGWTTYTTSSVNVVLPAGQQTLSFIWTGPSGFYFNVDYFDVSLISDVTPPVITLLGANPLDIPLNGTYSDPGATASDNIDGDISTNIAVGGDVVDPTSAGTYIVTYDVSDAAGNAAVQVTRTVTVLAGVDNPPSISAISDVAVNEGDNINISISVSDDNNPSATIEIFDKSAGGTVSTSPVSSVPTTTISAYSFTGSAGSYTLDWTPGAGDGRSYLARVTADDGVNSVVVEEFTIDVAQQVPGSILAKTFKSPLPWYASSTPQSPFTVAIETNATQNIGYIDNGDFVEYLINVPAAGTYDIEFTASNGSGSNGSSTDINILEEGNGSAIGTVVVPKIGWTSFFPYSTQVSFANAGIQTLRLEFDGGVNVASFTFSTPVVGNNPPTVSIANPLDGATFFSGDNITFNGSATDPEEGSLGASLSWSSDLDGGFGSGETVNTTNLSPGTHTITASVTDNDLNNPLSGDASISITINNPAPSCNVSFRVNAGGALLADPGGDFTADQATSTANGSANTGTPSPYYTSTSIDKTFGATTALVSNTTGYPDVMFQTERYYDGVVGSAMNWEFPTGNGIYDVKILFNENWNNENTNPRVFDIEIEGNVVEAGYRPSGPNGTDVNVAKVEAYQVSVADGTLDVDFIKISQNPAIKGFDICFVGPLPSSTPVAAFSAIPTPVACDQSISFDGTTSSHTSGGTFSIVSYEWDFDYDGITFDMDASGSTTTHTYNASQPSFDVALQVTDNQGTPVSDIEVLTINLTSNLPTANPGGPYVINLGDDLTLDGSASSDPDAACGDAIASWAWELNGDASFNDASGASPVLTAADLTNLGLGVGSHTVELTVTDNFGNPNTVSTTLDINLATVALPLCLNIGNQGAITAFGRSFVVDNPYLVGSASNFNKLTSTIEGTVPGSGEEDLFQSEAFADPLSYAIPTGNGSFTVELYFAELYIGVAGAGANLGTGDRIFDIKLEGSTVESGIDMVDDFGPLTAFTKTFTVTVTDGILNVDIDATVDNGKLSGLCVSEAANFTPNAAPTIAIDPVVDPLDCENDGENLILTASASDAEQGDMTAAIIWKDDQGTAIGPGGSLSLTGLTAGTYTYTAEITDATPSTTSASVTFEVVANTAPTLSAIVASPSTITAGSSISLSSTASDVEDDDNTLVISWTSDLENPAALGTGASINPTLTAVGPHTITASVTDACNETTTITTQVVVSSVVVNAPVITITAPLANATIDRGVQFTASATVTDVEDDDTQLGNTLSWSSVNGTATNFGGTGASINGLILTPGTHVLQATVTDSDNNTTTETVSVNVPGPVVDFSFPADGGSVPTTDVTVAWTAQNMLFTSPFDEHFHLYVNPPDLNNLVPMTHISTASQLGQLFWDLTAADGIQVGVNTIVIVAAEGGHIEFTNAEAMDIVNFQVLPPGSPVADFTASANTVDCGTVVNFDGSTSSHTGAFNIASYEWDFNYDGSTFDIDASGATSSITYNTIGTYTAALRVTDDQNPAVSAIQTASIVVTTSNAPIAAAGGPYAITLGDDLVLDGSGSSDPDVVCGDAITTYEWELNGDASYDDATGAQPTVSALDLGTLGLGVGTHTVSLRVTDSQGLSNTEDVSLVISAPSTDVFFVINPAVSNVNENDAFSLIVQVQANSQQIDVAEVHLSFDPAVVQVSGLSPLASSILPNPVVSPLFDNTLGTIDFGAGALSNFPSGTFDLLQIDLVAVGGPSTDIDFTFNLPASTIATFAFQNVLSGTSPATINVTENPELIITPDVFNEALTEGSTTTNSFSVTTSDGSPLPADLALSENSTWLAINPGNDGYSIDATGLLSGPYTGTITATGTGYDDAVATISMVVSPSGTPAAFLEILPGAGLGSSTFGGSSAFSITNQSTGTVRISSISIDLGTGILPDMVFDPIGTGGDATAQCFTAGPTATAVGLVAPADNCVDPFSAPRQGGFDVISMDFAEFDPSEQFTFSVDIDPNSIQGVPGAGGAGSVSGYEIVGATVTINFNDGSTIVSSLFEEGSLGGANVLAAPAAPVAPSIAVVGVTPTPATVTDPNQIITLTGTPGDNVTLLQMDSRTYIATGAPPFNVPNVTYYANEAMSGKFLYSATIGAGGTVDIPVVLVQTPGATGTPDGGINRFLAVSHAGTYGPDIQTSPVSNPIILKLDVPTGIPAAFVEITPGSTLLASTFGGSSAFSISNQSTGNLQISSVSIDLGTGLLPDMVFDPTGSGGDATAQCFTAGATATTVGLVAPADICVDPFSAPRQGGFDVITVDFTEFDPTEQFTFGVDIDPNSIQGVPGAGGAGAVSGFELVGATVTVTFNDGSTLVGSLYEEGSLGGSNVLLSTAAPSTPSISVVGVSPTPATVGDPNQTFTVSGTPGDNVSLLLMDSRTFIASLA